MSDAVKILLIEDDEDDYVLVRSMLSEVPEANFALHWERTFEAALSALSSNGHDVCLLDYRLGRRDGLELLKEANNRKIRMPVILLTGQGDHEVDLEAMKAGATDYLVKGQINAMLLDRSIRYAVERKKAENALRKSQRELRFLSSRLIAAQERERKRIARDLHDSTCQSLGVIKMTVEKSLGQLDEGSAAAQTLKPLLPLIPSAIEEIRRIIKDLRPSSLDDLGILTTVTALCREFKERHPGIRMEETLAAGESEIPDALKIVIYRVLQEALNNVSKHSKANVVQVSLARTNGNIDLAVRDNGHGFEPDKTGLKDLVDGGVGLSSMKERVELSGGTLSIWSAPGAGTAVSAKWCARSR